MPQDETGRELGLESGAPAEERGRHIRDELKRIIISLQDLEKRIQKFKTYDDRMSLVTLVDLYRRAQKLHERWKGELAEAEGKATMLESQSEFKPMQPLQPVGRNQTGGVVFDLSVKVGKNGA